MASSQRARRRQQLAERRQMIQDRFWRPKRCEILWDDGCEGVAVDAHEMKSRGRGGSITDSANILGGCRHCHRMAHAHPEEAHRRGVLRHSWE